MKLDLLTTLVLENGRLMELCDAARRAGRDDVAAEIRKAGSALMIAIGKLQREPAVVS